MKAELLNITEAEYHKNSFSDAPCYSNSIGKIIIANSPGHAKLKHPKLNANYKDDNDSKYSIGTIAHAAILQGLDVCTVIDAADYRTNVAKEARDLAFAAGKVPILAKQYEPLQAMVKAGIEQIESCADLGYPKLADGKGEQTIIVSEDELAIKMRLDWLANNRKLIIDYKTTDVQNPDAWIRSIVKMGYDMQAATYAGGVELLTGEAPKFVFAVQETTAPYAMYFVGIDNQMMEFGKMRVARAVSIFRDCLRRNEWPMYDSRIRWAELKPWEEGDFLGNELIGKADAKEGNKPVGYDVNAENAAANFLFGSVEK